MKLTHRTMIMSIGVIVFGTTLVASVYGYGGVMSRYGNGLVKERTHIRGQVVCAGCALEQVPGALPASRALLYELTDQQNRVVMEVDPGYAALPSRRLWLRGGDDAFRVLTAEENLFKEIEVSGLLRDTPPTLAILDLPEVRIVDEQ